MEENSWFSLSEAAKQLGVHFTTIRRWADQGRIEHIRTPGGKRMFNSKSIEDFLDRRRNFVKNPLAIEILRDRTLTQTRSDIQKFSTTNHDWQLRFSNDQRDLMRIRGNKLIALMFQYCLRETNGEVFLQEGERIAKEYGLFSITNGLTLDECIRTFLFFRRTMLSSIHETGSLQGITDFESQRLFQKMNIFLDEIMVGMVHEYSLLKNDQ